MSRRMVLFFKRLVLDKIEACTEQDRNQINQLHLHWSGRPETKTTWIGSNIPVGEGAVIYCHTEVWMCCEKPLAKLDEFRESK